MVCELTRCFASYPETIWSTGTSTSLSELVVLAERFRFLVPGQVWVPPVFLIHWLQAEHRTAMLTQGSLLGKETVMANELVVVDKKDRLLVW